MYNTHKITIPSNEKFGIQYSAQKNIQDTLKFNFADFPKGKEYPIITFVNLNSIAYKEGVSVGSKILKLNDISFYCKDLATIQCDFEYEKRTNSHITLFIQY